MSDTPAPSMQVSAREVNCSAIKLDVNYVREHLGDITPVFAGLPHSPEFLLDDANWIDYRSLLRIYDNIRRLFPDQPEVMRDIGRSVLHNDRSYAVIRMISVLIWSPMLIYDRVPSFLPPTFSFIRGQIVRKGRDYAVIEYVFDKGYQPSRDLLDHVVGLLEVAVMPAGYAMATVTYEIHEQAAFFDIHWNPKKQRRFAFTKRFQTFRTAIAHLEENKILLEQKNAELEQAATRIREQLARQLRLHELGLATSRLLGEEQLEQTLRRFFERNLGIRDALYVRRDVRNRFDVRWWHREGQAVNLSAWPVGPALPPRSVQRAMATAAQVRYEPRSLDLFLEAPDFYPKAAGFLLLPLLTDDRQRACLLLPADSTADATQPDHMQFLHAVRTEVELALGRVLAVGALEDMKAHLEQLVDQRTGELAKANDEIQRQLRQLTMLDRVKSDFLMGVSFELRNPLNLILSPLQLLLSRPGELNDEQRGSLETVHQNALVLLKHITNLLQLQQRDNFDVFLNYRAVAASDMLGRVYEIALEKGASTAIEVRADIPTDLPLVVVDVERVTSALHAIVSNAFKFNRPGGSVEIRAAVDEAFLRVDVRDTGIGIEEQQQAHLFERFQSHGDPMKKEYPGIGIGLSVASDTIQLHKGRITVKSKRGQGTTFSVFLPLGEAHVEEALRDRRRKQADGQAPQARRSQDIERTNIARFLADGRQALEYIDVVDVRQKRDAKQSRYALMSRQTVLFAHPDGRFLDVAETILLDYYNVLVASDGEEAWRLLTRERPDCLVCSPHLPRLSGVELIQNLRGVSEVAHTPSLLLSEKIDLQSRLMGLEHGADMYMTVPVDFNALVAHVRSLIEMRELRRTLEMSKLSLEDQVSELAAERERLSMGIIEALALAIDAKDRYTHGHSARVREFATGFARHLGTDEHGIKRLEFSSILHDVGKIGVPEEILNKTERLNDADWEELRSHPVKGVRILGVIPGYPDALKEIRSHHERWDGRGYPDGLRGEAIPYGARIIALADSFDAMSYDRVYRKARSVEEIAAEIERCAGSQFDPNLARSFLAYLDSRNAS